MSFKEHICKKGTTLLSSTVSMDIPATKCRQRLPKLKGKTCVSSYKKRLSRLMDYFLVFCATFLLFKTIYFRSPSQTTVIYHDAPLIDPGQEMFDEPRLRSLVSIHNNSSSSSSSSDVDIPNASDLRPIQIKMIKALNAANASLVTHPARSIRHTRPRLIHSISGDGVHQNEGIESIDHQNTNDEDDQTDNEINGQIDGQIADHIDGQNAITDSPTGSLSDSLIPSPSHVPTEDEWYSYLTNKTYATRNEYFQAVKQEKDRRNTIHSKLKNITTKLGDTTPWKGYRLGDMFEKHWLRHASNGMHHAQINYPGSIAVEYMERLQDPLHSGDSDYELMLDIVDRRSRNASIVSLLPDDHTLVIHLRTGDVIDKDDRPISDFLKYNDVTAHLRKGRNYTRGLPFYQQIWDQIQSEGIEIDRILLLTGWHYSQNHWRSIEYIDAVIEFMEGLVDDVDIRINEIPDEDFLIMVNSKYFVKSGGGFSRMIGGVVERKGGRIFGFS